MLVPKPGIPYENRGPVALWVKGVVIAAIERITPFPKVEAVEAIVAQTGDDWLGGRTRLVVTSVEEI
jgi:hypothetical protein